MKKRNLSNFQNLSAWPPSPPRVAAQRGLSAALRHSLDIYLYCLENDLFEIISRARGKALDVGCGDQPYRKWFVDCQYQGIDVASAAGDFGYRNADTNYYEKGGPWPVPKDSFNFVLASEVLEHVLDPRKFLKSAYQALAPGGTLCVTVPFAYRWHFVPEDYYRYTPSALASLLEESGFGQIKIYARGNPFTTVVHKILVLIFADHMAGNKIRGILWIGLLAPAWIPLAVLGRLTADWDFGHDPLGYTATAKKS